MLGQLLGHYRILEEIGAGGMGVVYRARDERLHRDVAVKILPAGLLTDDSARQRFSREAFALSRLNHPNIETVFDFDSQQGIDFIVMELIPGASLDVKLSAGDCRRRKRFTLVFNWPKGWPPHTSRESFIATSSPPICGSRPMGG